MIEWVTLALATAACLLAYQGIAFYKKDRAAITTFFAEAKPVIDQIKQKADDEDYIAVVAGKALEQYLPHDVVYDMARGIAQHSLEGSLPYIMDRVEESIPNLIASAFSSDLARDLQSKSVAAKSVFALDGNVKGKQALQFGLQKLMGGVNIPLDQVIAGYQAIKELQSERQPSNGNNSELPDGVVIDYGLPSASEVGRA